MNELSRPATSMAEPVVAGPARLDWVDAAKGIGITLVVFGHVIGGLINSTLSIDGLLFPQIFLTLYVFHMPLFFFLSGLFVAGRIERGPLGFLTTMVRSILYPYFLWSIVQYSAIFAAGQMVNAPATGYWSTILALPWQPVSQFWFLQSLFLMHLLSLVLLSRIGPTALLLVALALKAVAELDLLSGPLHATASLLPYYAIGVFLGVAGTTDMIVRRPGWVRLVLLQGLAAGLLFLTVQALIRDAAPGVFDGATEGIRGAQIIAGVYDYPAMAAALAMIAAVLGVSATASGWLGQALCFIGRLALPIFILHVLFLAGLRIAMTAILGVQNVLVILPCIFAAGMLGPIATVLLLRRLSLARPLGLI